MSRTRVVAVLAAAVLVVGTLLALRGGEPAGRDEGGGAKADSQGRAESTPSAGPGEIAVVTEDGAGGGEGGGEGGAGGGGGLPGLSEARRGSLVKGPVPANASGRARLVAGYPRDVLAPVPGSRVRSNSVASTGRAVQVALVAAAPGPAEPVARFYRQALGRLGFSESTTRAVGGSTGLSFERGRDSVVLTIRAGDGRAAYSLFAMLHKSST